MTETGQSVSGSRKCETVITRELVGISRSDASVAPAGVGGGLEARVTCGDKIAVKRRGCPESARFGRKQTGPWLCCPLTVKPGTVCDMQVGDILHLWSGFLHKDRN